MSTTVPKALCWEAEIPLLTNRHVLAGLSKAVLGAVALVSALVTLLLAVQGEWHLVPRIGGLLLAIGMGLGLL